MQIIGSVIILFGVAFWAGHTHKVRSWEPRAPEQCQVFDTRYDPRFKAMCDAWDARHATH
jgi:hypothetical protein